MAIDSVRQQSYKDFELIVVDGGSTDGSQAIVEANKDIVSKFISEPDKGQSDALNKGFALAEGEYFLWLNADDMLLPRLLEFAAKFLAADGQCRWVAFDSIYISEDARITGFHFAPFWISALNKRHRPQVECPTAIFSRELYNRAGGFDLQLDYTMDMDLWWRFIAADVRWYRLHYYGYAFRAHGLSKTNKGTKKYVSPPIEQAQGEILRKKHNIRTNPLFRMASRFIKILYCYPRSIISTLRWRRAHIEDYVRDELRTADGNKLIAPK